MECETISLVNAGIFTIIREIFSVTLAFFIFILPVFLFIIKKNFCPFKKIVFLILSIFFSKLSYILWLRFCGFGTIYWVIIHIAISAIINLVLKNLAQSAGSGINMGKKDIIGISAIIFVMLFLVIIPQSKIAVQEDNLFLVRAYFRSDYLKHVAVSAEIAKGEVPVKNPFFSGHNLHYYWIYYLLPSLSYKIAGSNASLLRINIFSNQLVNILLIIVMYLFASNYIESLLVRITATFSAIYASSYEGLMYVVESIKNRVDVLTSYTSYNIDGLTRWRYGQPQIDTLYRSLLYTPQQQIGFLGLILFVYLILNEDKFKDSLKIHYILPVIAGIILGYNFFCGMFVAGWMFFVYPVLLLFRSERLKEIILRQAKTFLIYLFFPALYKILDMLLESKDAIIIGLRLYKLRNLSMILLLNYSWLWVPITLLLFMVVLGKIRAKNHINNIFVLTSLSAASVFLIAFMQIRGFEGDVGLKIGQVLNIVLFISLVYFIHLSKKKILLAVLAILIIPGLLTVSIDFLNGSNIKGAPDTFVTRFRFEDICAMRWIKNNIPGDAVIQTLPDRDDPRASIVPIFGERRIALGDEMHSRIYVLQEDEVYDRRKEKITRMFYADDINLVYEIAEEYNIRYIFLGTVEREINDIVSNMDRFPKAYEGYGTTLYDLGHRPVAEQP